MGRSSGGLPALGGASFPAAAAKVDALANPTVSEVGAILQAYNGATWDRLRTPTTFKTVAATGAGNTAVWTPTLGKKFRVMYYTIEVPENTTIAGAGGFIAKLQDATTDIGPRHEFFLPAAGLSSIVGGYLIGPIVLGNGFLSAAANNALNINLGAAITGSEVRCNAWGTEE